MAAAVPAPRCPRPILRRPLMLVDKCSQSHRGPYAHNAADRAAEGW